MDKKNQREIGRIEKRLRAIANRKAELIELIHPYQVEINKLYHEAEALREEQSKMIEKA